MNTKLSDMKATFNCDFKDKQHAELLQLVRSIHNNGSRIVEELCNQGDQILGQEQNLLRETWRQDVIERLEYEKDQSNSG